MSRTVEWAARMLRALDGLPDAEKAAYGWLGEHRGMVAEMEKVFGFTNDISKLFKNNGLSHDTVGRCHALCAAFAAEGAALSETMSKYKKMTANYLDAEKAKLPDEKQVWNNSSDIIESLFGSYKARKADNQLYGVTAQALLLPLLTMADTERSTIDWDVKAALESVTMTQIERWKDLHLIGNQVIKRKKILKK